MNAKERRPPDLKLPIQAPPVHREEDGAPGHDGERSGVTPSLSRCAKLPGPARQMCYLAS
ncbi:hypothetical protein [Streptomyces sp. NRRL S-813]|uniref:hypothetical protein n=1 Tax=Streptomyces sp. NRRL S-813 TaxID=1463919 RepID=UPI00131BE395|nr:hypothetical protein [Streptomyces sp. NRRL S-813]